MPRPVVIEGEEKWEVEKILNKRKVRGKEKFLVRWKGFTAETDTWEGRENLRNAKEVLRDFEREYGRDKEDIRRQEKEEEKGIYDRGELPGRYTAKKLFGWSGKRYDNEYWSRMKWNWRRWKGKKLGRKYGKRRMETIPEILPEEESWRGGTVITPGYIEELDDEGRLRNNEYLHYEVTNEECDGMGEICDPYEGL